LDYIPTGCIFTGFVFTACVSLRQREWNHADGQKQKYVKRASNKMSFDVGVNLFFHRGGFCGAPF
jgi:hypothetical protein